MNSVLWFALGYAAGALAMIGILVFGRATQIGQLQPDDDEQWVK
jgi:hypothetical protein